MSIRKQAISGLKWTAAGKFGAQIITWAITLIVIRILTPEDYGLLAMATIFTAFMLMLSEAGLTTALIQKQNLDESSLRSVFAIIITINLGLLTLLNLLAPVIAAFFGEEHLVLILRVLSLQFILSIFGTLPSMHMYRELKFKHLSLVHLAATIFGSLLTLILALSQFGVWALIFGNLLTSLFNVVALNIISPFYLRPRFSLTGMRSTISFGGTVMISRVLWSFFMQIDAVIVGKLLGKEMLGFYSVSMQLASLPVQRISAIINQVAFPVFSRMQDNREQFQSVVLKSIRLLGLIAFPILWGISSIAYEIVSLILGVKWEAAALPLQLLTLVMPLRVIAQFLPSTTDARGRPDVNLKNIAFTAMIMPVAIFYGAQWEIVGVALAWVVVYPFILFFNLKRSLKVIDLGFSDLVYAVRSSVIISIIMYFIVSIMGWLLADYVNLLIKLVAMIISGAMIYVCLTFFYNRKVYAEAIELIKGR